MSQQITDNTDAECFELTQDGKPAGFLKYASRPGIQALLHTEIDSEFGGQGLGGVLVGDVLERAARAGDRVLPFCGYVSHYIAKHDQYLGLVPETMRKAFDLPEAGSDASSG